MTRFELMQRWSDGFVAALTPLPIDESRGEIWLAGYTAGYKMRAEKNRLLDEYLVSTGRKPQARFRYEPECTQHGISWADHWAGVKDRRNESPCTCDLDEKLAALKARAEKLK